VAQATGKRAKIGLSRDLHRNFIAVRVSPGRGNLCMVPPLWGYRRES
jgi:hypothetical protein